jgi:hypothetical protein
MAAAMTLKVPSKAVQGQCFMVGVYLPYSIKLVPTEDVRNAGVNN